MTGRRRRGHRRGGGAVVKIVVITVVAISTAVAVAVHDSVKCQGHFVIALEFIEKDGVILECVNDSAGGFGSVSAAGNTRVLRT